MRLARDLDGAERRLEMTRRLADMRARDAVLADNGPGRLFHAAQRDVRLQKPAHQLVFRDVQPALELGFVLGPRPGRREKRLDPEVFGISRGKDVVKSRLAPIGCLHEGPPGLRLRYNSLVPRSAPRAFRRLPPARAGGLLDR